MKNKKVVIIGGGFGGLTAGKVFNDESFDVLIIDKTNHHLFQPLLYQVASAVLSPGDIAFPIREVFRHYKNVHVLMDEVISIDKQNRKVLAKDREYEYDYLIVAPGSRHSYFGKKEWEVNAPGLKTLKDALLLRENILNSYEQAEKLDDEEAAKKYLTFVIVGGGPTGVEMAGAIAEIARKTLLKDFRKINSSNSKIIIVEGASRILGTYPEKLSKHALDDLKTLGVEVRLNSFVTDITERGVKIGNEFIETSNIIWAAGNEIPPIIKSIGIETDKVGRAKVNSDLSVPGYPEIFIIGDAALVFQMGNNYQALPPLQCSKGGMLQMLSDQGKNLVKENHTNIWIKVIWQQLEQQEQLRIYEALSLQDFLPGLRGA